MPTWVNLGFGVALAVSLSSAFAINTAAGAELKPNQFSAEQDAATQTPISQALKSSGQVSPVSTPTSQSTDNNRTTFSDGNPAAPVTVTSTEVLRRYVRDLATRHGMKLPDASVITRAELGKFFIQLMQSLAALPNNQFTDQDFLDIGFLSEEFQDSMQSIRGRLAMYLFKQEAASGAAQAAQINDHGNRLAILERTKVSGDFTYAPQSDMGTGIKDTMASNMRGRINFTVKAYDADPKKGSGLGDATVFMRLTGATGRFFPRNRYLLTPENALVDSSANPFNSGVDEVQIANLQVNNNNSNNVRPTVSMEQMYYAQDFRFGKLWKGQYRLGLNNFANYFDSNNYANNETTQYLNTSFVNNISWRPNWIGPSEITSIERSLFRGKAFLRGTAGVISLASRDYWGGWSADYELQAGHNFFKKEGNFRVGFWHHTFRAGTAVVPFLTPVDLAPSGLLSILPGDLPNGHAPAKRSQPCGLYLNFDQKIWKNIGVWARYAINDKQLGDVYLGGLLSSRQSWSTGLEIPVGSFFKRRPDDAIGIAYGQVSPYNRDGTITPASPAFVSLNGVLATNLAQSNANLKALSPHAVRSADEKVLEAYYRFQLNKQVSISPDVQLYWNGGGVAPQPKILVLGSRLNVSF